MKGVIQIIIDNNKDKLVDLITKAQNECDDSDRITNTEQIAEYLLANGVVILNHKLGENVYEVREFCIPRPSYDENYEYEIKKMSHVLERPMTLSDIRLQMDIFLDRKKAENRAHLYD